MRGACPGTSSRRVGGPTRSRLITVGPRGSSSKFLWNLNWVWRVGKIKAERRFFGPSKGGSRRMEGTTIRTCHVPLSPLTQKPHSGTKRGTSETQNPYMLTGFPRADHLTYIPLHIYVDSTPRAMQSGQITMPRNNDSEGTTQGSK
jgi:hypothetical protein